MTIDDTELSADQKLRSLLDWALWYYDQGFCVIPAYPKEKRPIVEWKAYQKERPSREQIIEWFKNKTTIDINIGLICGEVSGNLVIFDFDDIKIYYNIDTPLEDFIRVTTTGSGKKHLWYRSNILPKSFKINEIGLEVRSTGNYTIVPPSIHPNGKQYEFVDLNIPVFEVEDAEDEAWKIAARLGVEKGRPSRSTPTLHFIHKLSNLRPCFKKFVNLGGDLPHNLRLALVQEALANGFGQEQIVDLFKNASDFDRAKCSRYVDYAVDSAMDSGIMPWRCETIREHGGCLGPTCELYDRNVLHSDYHLNPEDFFEKDHNGRIKRFVPKRLGDTILERYRFVATSEKSDIWIYKEDKGIWESNGIEFIQYITTNWLKKFFKPQYTNDVETYIRNINYKDISIFEKNPEKIVVSNGVLNIKTKELEPFDPELYALARIPVNFDPGADCPEIKKFLEEILEPSDIEKMIELIGYCLYRRYKIAVFTIFLGTGRNGKSTLLNLINTFLGRENVSHVTLQQLDQDRFAASELYGKLANTAGDIPDRPIKYTGWIKQLTGDDIITAQKKHRDHFSFRNYAKLIFSANKLPATYDDTTAFFRRALVINFPNEFPEGAEGTDINILDKITTDKELSGLLNEAVEGLTRLLEQGSYSDEITVEEKRERYVYESNPIQYFCENYVEVSDNHEDFILKSELYTAYRKLCFNLGQRPTANAVFSREAKRYLPHIDEGKKRISGDEERVWYGIRLREDS